MERELLDVLVVNETFLRIDQDPDFGVQVVLLNSGPQSGRTANLIRRGLQFKMLRRQKFGTTELMAIRVGGALFGGIYCPPHCNWEHIESALE